MSSEERNRSLLSASVCSKSGSTCFAHELLFWAPFIAMAELYLCHLLTSPLELIRSTTDEAAAWRDLQEFRASILSKPWYVPPNEEKRLKEEADGTKARAEEKARRKAQREAKELKRRAQREERERRKTKRAEQNALRHPERSKRRTSDKENVAT